MGKIINTSPKMDNDEQPFTETTQPQEEFVDPENRKLKPWQVACLRDLRDTSISYSDLAVKYGRNKDTITKLRKRFDVDRPPQAKSGPKPATDRRPLSDGHRALGCRMTIYRGGHTYSDVGATLGVSRAVVRNIELGIHDVTLLQICRICKILNLPIEELLKPYRLPKLGKS